MRVALTHSIAGDCCVVSMVTTVSSGRPPAAVGTVGELGLRPTTLEACVVHRAGRVGVRLPVLHHAVRVSQGTTQNVSLPVVEVVATHGAPHPVVRHLHPAAVVGSAGEPVVYPWFGNQSLVVVVVVIVVVVVEVVVVSSSSSCSSS